MKKKLKAAVFPQCEISFLLAQMSNYSNITEYFFGKDDFHESHSILVSIVQSFYYSIPF